CGPLESVRRTSVDAPSRSAKPVLASRAGNGIRTRDIQLGRLTLYQLSYSRDILLLRSAEFGGGGRIRTFEGMSRQIYSLLPLAARAPLPTVVLPPKSRRRSSGFRDTNGRRGCPRGEDDADRA